MKKKIRAKAQCSSCGGTGLYSGMAESENCAVACTTCDGTGCEIIDISYTPFTKRRKTNKIKRVFSGSCGYKHSADDVTTKEGVTIKFSQAGCTYDEWLKGAEPKPVKELYCPYLWTGQRLQCSGEDKNGLYIDQQGLSLFLHILFSY